MYIKNDQGTAYYEVEGPEGGPAVVFSHGVAMDHRTFERQVLALKEHYRVIIWDMPYHGYSSEIDRKLQFSKTAANFIIDILNELRIEQAVFAGLSLGSFVVQQAVCNYPDRVKAAVHISGGPLYPRYPAVLKASIPFSYLLMKAYPVRLLNKSFAKHKALTADTQAYLMETMSQTGKDVVIHLINEMVRDMVLGLPEPPAHPALIVYGDHDLRFLRQMSTTWHHRQPYSRLVKIANAHHILNQDNPEAFNQALLNFLQETVTS
jgi:3-oxoadipate enol-lactonase